MYQLDRITQQPELMGGNMRARVARDGRDDRESNWHGSLD
jgi:hypothetical protein